MRSETRRLNLPVSWEGLALEISYTQNILVDVSGKVTTFGAGGKDG